VVWFVSAEEALSWEILSWETLVWEEAEEEEEAGRGLVVMEAAAVGSGWG
jgi:hypothetical protein